MNARRRTVVAVATAAILGLVAGAVAAFVVPATSTSGDFEDPLHLGVPLQNQSCSGQDLLLVAWGDTRPALAPGVRDNPGAKYLRTAQSCPTWWDHGAQPTPTYTAYLGPYDASGSRGCALRMSAAHKGDVVTRLDDGTERFVVCVCELSSSAAPTLSPGMSQDVGDGIWIRALQETLQDLRLNQAGDLSDSYDAITQTEVKKFQQLRGLAVTGTVDEATWRALRTRACRRYSY
ncbi:MAG: peptidoglycan-binding domain-containing protein [Nocardioides sp.]